MKTINKNEKGITLIALVITIIVLLLLAGVAILMLTGENGILIRANDAKKESKEREEEEAVRLAVQAALITGNGEITSNESYAMLNDELRKVGYDGKEITSLPATAEIGDKKYNIDKYGNVTKQVTIAEIIESGETVDSTTTLTADDGYTITVPENFKISKESPTEVTKGMIIEDSTANQYVWIPVFELNECYWGVDYSAVADLTEGTTEYYTAIETALKEYTKTYIESVYPYYTKTWTDTWFGDEDTAKHGYYDGTNFIYYTNGNMTESEYNTLYHNMLDSVYKNKGFYIGRYEMGIEVVNSVEKANSVRRTEMTEYTASSANNTSTEKIENGAPSIEGMPTPVSKANAVGYNWITQSQAQMLAQKLDKEADYSKVTSSIMFGVQWDAVCVFIEKCDKNNTAVTKSDWLTKNDYGKLWGNYETSIYTLNRGFYLYGGTYVKSSATKSNLENWLCTTGAVDENKSLNIYDFGGNLEEWTLERQKDREYPCSSRGGDCFGNLTGASERQMSYSTYSCWYNRGEISSRVSLYII